MWGNDSPMIAQAFLVAHSAPICFTRKWSDLSHVAGITCLLPGVSWFEAPLSRRGSRDVPGDSICGAERFSNSKRSCFYHDAGSPILAVIYPPPLSRGGDGGRYWSNARVVFAHGDALRVWLGRDIGDPLSSRRVLR